jgi:hypothetical protein
MVNEIEHNSAFDCLGNFYLAIGIVILIMKIITEDYNEIIELFKK